MSYTPTSWVNGELVSADDMNRIEQGIAGAAAGGATDPAFAAVIADPVSATRVALDGRYGRKISVNVLDYGAKGDGTTDDSAAFQSAVNALGSSGGRVVIPNTGAAYIFRGSTPTTSTPKRTLITTDGVEIEGVGMPTIKMVGVSKAYIDSINDVSSSGRDVFTVFTFLRTKRGGVRGIRFEGEWDGVGKFRYLSPRAKGVGFIGVGSGFISECQGENLLGNLVNVTPSDATVDGVYASAYNVTVERSIATRCLEGGFNSMGNTFDTRFKACTGSYCGSSGIENGATRGVIESCTALNNKVAGFAISGTSPSITGSVAQANGSAGEYADGGVGITVNGTFPKVKGCSFVDNEGSAMVVYPSTVNPSITDCEFSGNTTLAGTSSVISAVGGVSTTITDLVIEGNRFTQGGASVATYILNLSYVDGGSVRGNRIRVGAAATLSILVQGSSANVEVERNDVNKAISVSTSAPASYKASNTGDAKRTVEGAAPPTTGTWAVGDRVRNTSTTAAGSVVSWTCTAAGTPGTWRIDGVVEVPAQPTSQLELLSALINTSGKFVGRMVWNSTTGRPVFAGGTSASSTWRGADGAVVHTPV